MIKKNLICRVTKRLRGFLFGRGCLHWEWQGSKINTPTATEQGHRHTHQQVRTKGLFSLSVEREELVKTMEEQLEPKMVERRGRGIRCLSKQVAALMLTERGGGGSACSVMRDGGFLPEVEMFAVSLIKSQSNDGNFATE